MKLLVRLCVLVLLTGLWAAPAEAQFWRTRPKPTPQVESPLSAEITKLLAEAKSLQDQYKESEALARYELVLAKAPATYEALWRAAVLSVRIGARYTDETRKIAYFSAARLYASRALVVRPEAAESNYAEALALANQATLLTSRARLLAYREMRPYIFKAVTARPDFADAWQLLGRWHFRVDHYNILERIFSRLFLGGTPDGASSAAAVEAMTKAHQLEPQRIQFAYDLARIHIAEKQRTRAIAALQDAIEITPVTAEELEISRRCRKLLVQLNRKLLKQVQEHLRGLD
ncbi:tetratricopeptide repeat protein [Hymenobacter sp.]|jgi:tetratricopeptide (TPR) repeat protein|uniref:tetratricopeptide repeat protein n=1 Tax=Hymenobacter sp. TaxID=1898978 RepID=UPI002EDB7DA0